MYKISYAKGFKKDFKKLTQNEQDKTLQILERLANNETLESKYKDHALSGELNGIRDCHIKPDLILLYKKDNEILEILALRVGSHSDLFKK